MQLTHYGHSCLLLDTGDARILLDPGAFSSGFESVRDLTAVLITHQHYDHIDTERLPALLEANPGARLIVDPGTVQLAEKLGLNAVTARSGDAFELDGTQVTVVGGQHARIHADIPVVPNVGYVFDHGAFYHPGDAFFVPEQHVAVLALPTAAPWLKAGEAVDFLRAVAPRLAVPVHEAVLSRPQMHYGLFTNLAGEGTEVRVLPRGEQVEV
ncbi:putative Zn-dependent hydrolase of beta-lactamase fold [Saccharomonospora marina XMU15]|uniref:Putative Zn-dependent hydrolase of beta-lactamase fold n=1 Tax=Saccharomonospora marina XMU15 TaxID=882083 RepID=H5XA36_9PSEU|nr:MBL fold metallo-hydrolase [Saccharomonospora marina]EHR53696.1 putative Zn-dependent hydrolase of beta-lactamase fold [Saccharomonospora marina XMU15]